ncbi:MAG: PBP1A family penicillin-binding protein [Rickettsiales bacterium]|nr:PBP1A family penicillin-binding protein [Rickettsiales bacterium]
MLGLFIFFKGLPDLNSLKKVDGSLIQINYSNNRVITSDSGIYDTDVSYYDFPRNLVNAVVAIEDRKFFEHNGVDIFGILRAFYVNYKKGKIAQGGSTITQQLAKLMFLTPQRSIKRKIEELLLAIQLERKFSKEEIITFYLNKAYFGAGNYGVKNAAKGYFDKEVSDLNLNECAILAGLLKAPSKLSPKNNKKLAEIRANVVLKAMIEEGYVDENHIEQIDDDANYKIDHLQRLYFVDYVKKHYQEFLSQNDEKEQIIKITTTMDYELQERLENITDRFVVKNKADLKKSQLAVMVMSFDGAILAMTGGRDYQHSQFNRAADAKRQTGSVFKTIVYLAAFEKGAKIDDIMEDKEVTYGDWLPQNYKGKYFGDVTLKEAFAKSLNSVAINLGKKIGGEEIKKMARKLGVFSDIQTNDLTIMLGSSELSLLEVVSVYASIANDGSPVIPYFINEISDGRGNMMYERYSSGLPRVVSEQSLLNIKELLREVVVNGTGKVVNRIENNHSKLIYGKTGTSQKYRDAWFVGFDKDYVVGVWIGNDDNSPTKNISGGSLPAQLFGEIMSGY